jgi:OmpA-OmpF porin, OOP family
MSTVQKIPRHARGIFLYPLLYLSAFLLSAQPLFPQALPARAFFPRESERYSIVEKTSMRQRINGKYQGFVYDEVRGTLRRTGTEEALYSGSFYLLQSLTRDLRNVARRLDDAVRVEMRITPDGRMLLDPAQDYPLLRDFPGLPSRAVAVGERWRSEGVRVVDPLRRGGTRVPFLCEYEYLGMKEYNGAPAHIIKAQYAVRYRGGEDPYGDENLRSLQGRHIVDIYLPAEEGLSAFMRDTVDELYAYADGSQVQRSGFILTWYEDFAALDRGGIREELERVVSEEKLEEVSVEDRDEGLAVNIRNLRFYPDSPELLPGESTRISAIASVLKRIDERTFLVVGHTADVGSGESQIALSIERAKTVVDLLTGEGIEAGRFLYRGVGGTQPIAPNDTEAGRALNRRVEILILED